MPVDLARLASRWVNPRESPSGAASNRPRILNWYTRRCELTGLDGAKKPAARIAWSRNPGRPLPASTPPSLCSDACRQRVEL